MSYLTSAVARQKKKGLLGWKKVVCKGMNVGRGGSSAGQKWKTGLEQQFGTKLLRAMNTSRV